MPRRAEPDPLCLAVGQRLRALRTEAGLTLEQLAARTALGSKGHLSNLEKGLVCPTVQTLKSLADALVFLGWHYQHDAAPIPPEPPRERTPEPAAPAMTAAAISMVSRVILSFSIWVLPYTKLRRCLSRSPSVISTLRAISINLARSWVMLEVFQLD